MGSKDPIYTNAINVFVKHACGNTKHVPKSGTGYSKNRYFTQDDLNKIIDNATISTLDDTAINVTYRFIVTNADYSNRSIHWKIIVKATDVNGGTEEVDEGIFSASKFDNIINSKSDNPFFNMGSAISYVKRYVISNHLNLNSCEIDLEIDGNTQVHSYQEPVSKKIEGSSNNYNNDDDDLYYVESRGVLKKSEALDFVKKIAQNKDNSDAFIKCCLNKWKSNYIQRNRSA